jgi:hypothetical protein
MCVMTGRICLYRLHTRVLHFYLSSKGAVAGESYPRSSVPPGMHTDYLINLLHFFFVHNVFSIHYKWDLRIARGIASE